jgi:cyanate permease
MIALVAVGGRILWSRYAERSGTYRGPLFTMAGLSLIAAGLFLASGQITVWLLWPATIVIALGSSSWNAVGMLAVMIEAGVAATGRASGIVLFGFLTGLGLGPPVFGRIANSTGSYTLMWVLSAAAAIAAGGVVITWSRSVRPS